MRDDGRQQPRGVVGGAFGGVVDVGEPIQEPTPLVDPDEQPDQVDLRQQPSTRSRTS